MKHVTFRLIKFNTLKYNGTIVWTRQKDVRGENTKTNYGMDTTGEKKKRTSNKEVDGRSKSSHDSKKFRTISMKEQRGMAFGFGKTETAVKNTGHAGRQAGRQADDR
jgi:hypothetical protein